MAFNSHQSQLRTGVRAVGDGGGCCRPAFLWSTGPGSGWWGGRREGGGAELRADKKRAQLPGTGPPSARHVTARERDPGKCGRVDRHPPKCGYPGVWYWRRSGPATGEPYGLPAAGSPAAEVCRNVLSASSALPPVAAAHALLPPLRP